MAPLWMRRRWSDDLWAVGAQVTDDNKEEYVALYATHRMIKGIKLFAAGFCAGFWSCLPVANLGSFSAEELGRLIAGRPRVTVEELRAAATYEGFAAEDATIRWFWAIVREMSAEGVAKLLAFITGMLPAPVGQCGGRSRVLLAAQGAFATRVKKAWGDRSVRDGCFVRAGSPRAPAAGLAAMRPPLLISRASTMRLPSAHTCASQLVLSRYDSKDALQQHVELVLAQPAAFHSG